MRRSRPLPATRVGCSNFFVRSKNPQISLYNELMSRLARALLPALAALLVAPAAHAYGWPVAPFREQHPIRGYFGDPRTIYWDPLEPNRFPENGEVSFHNGVDIVAAPGTAAYPVVSGLVRRSAGERVVVKAKDGRRFQYVHIEPTVGVGQYVRAGETVLGHVTVLAEHVHLTELSTTGRAVDPLLPGHLDPYYDLTPPHVQAIQLRNSGGWELDPYNLRGGVVGVAQAFDDPAMAVPAPWDGLPVAPAFIRWSLQTGAGRVVKRSTSVDFRARLPRNDRFWRVYARGTYQNHPRFAAHQYPGMPGRYLYRLGVLNTRSIRDGVYVLKVTAGDTRGNVGMRRQVVGICNHRRAPCERLEHERGPWKGAGDQRVSPTYPFFLS